MAYDSDAPVLEHVMGTRPPADSPVVKCWSCKRPIYKTPMAPQTPTEWRHASSGHPLSWSPDKHAAGVLRPQQHAHAWVLVRRDSDLHICAFVSCDSEMLIPARLEKMPRSKEAQIAAGWGTSIPGSKGK